MQMIGASRGLASFLFGFPRLTKRFLWVLPSLLCPSVVSSHLPAGLGSLSLPLPLSFSLFLLLYLPPAWSCALSPHGPATSSESPPPPHGLFSALLFGVSRKRGSTHTRWQGGSRPNTHSFPSKFSEARGS